MNRKIIFILLVTLLFSQASGSLLQFTKNIFTKAPAATPSFGFGVSLGSFGKGSFFGPTIHSAKKGCDIEVSKFDNAGKFGGFTDSFKNEISDMLSDLTAAAGPEALKLKNRLMNSLLSINRILTLLNQYPNKEAEFKPLLQVQVKKFLNDLDDIQDLMACQTNVTVVGSNNAVVGKTGTIIGNNSVNIGNQNTLIGNNNGVAGNKTIVAGSGNLVQGNNNVAVGKNNNVTANNAIAFTNSDVIDQSNTLTVGKNTIDLTKLNTKGKSTGYLVRD